MLQGVGPGASHDSRVDLRAAVTAGLLADRLDRADEAARRLVARGNCSAVALAIRYRGALVHERYFGVTRTVGGAPLTGGALFPIASVSKPLTAAATMILVDRGLLTLQTRVAELVPAFGANGKERVTVEHLLTHTSGLDERWIDAERYETHDAHLERVRAAPLLWPAGSHVAYCSAGFAALEEVIERAANVPASRFLAESLFAPAGMADTYYRPPPEQLGRIVECVRPNGRDMVRPLLATGSLAGAIFSTARDLVRFGGLFLEDGRTRYPRKVSESTASRFPPQVLSFASIGAMLTDRTGHLPPAPGAGGGTPHFGLGWMLARPTLWGCDTASPVAFGHTGSSGAYLLGDPTRALVVALLGNRWGGDPGDIPAVMNAAVSSVDGR
jgi:serine-type D-Ala-D-Ala carboxypeptidase